MLRISATLKISAQPLYLLCWCYPQCFWLYTGLCYAPNYAGMIATGLMYIHVAAHLHVLYNAKFWQLLGQA